MNACTYTERIIESEKVRSLVWSGDDLIDWIGGGIHYYADGTDSTRELYRRGYGYTFDAVVTEPSGEFTVVYTRVATKALLLRNGEILRELNRSYYCANAYEYPVTLVRRGEQVLLIHCPEKYRKLDIEDAASGELLTQRTSESSDFFHSRLSVSPGGRYLLSAGWFWHPLDIVQYYDLDEALRDPCTLDKGRFGPRYSGRYGYTEESSACWLQEGLVVLGASSEKEEIDPEDEEELDENRLRPNGLAVYDLASQAVRSHCELEEPAGTLMPVGTTHVMAFYQHPRLIRLADGHVEFSLPEISSGTQLGSITRSNLPPPLALDPERNCFAIARGNKIHVISITLPAIA